MASVIGPVAQRLGRDITQRLLLSLILDLMKDEFHDVRLNVVQHAGLICQVLGMDVLTHPFFNTVQSLIMDNQWRIRHAVVVQVPKLARQFGPEMFQSKLETLFLSSLSDSVHIVRAAAIEHMQEVADTFGAQWIVEHLLPKLLEPYSSSVGFLNRVTILNVLPRVSHVMSADQVVQYILPLLIKATKDVVPNVRFVACQTIQWMLEQHPLGTSPVNSIIKPALQELQQDPDIDVQYYSARAMACCNRN